VQSHFVLPARNQTNDYWLFYWNRPCLFH